MIDSVSATRAQSDISRIPAVPKHAFAASLWLWQNFHPSLRSSHPLVFVDTGRGQSCRILSSFEFCPVSVLEFSKCTKYFMLSARIYPQPYSSKINLSLLSSVPSTDPESLPLPRNTRIDTVHLPPTQPFIDVITDATPTPSYISTLRSSPSTYPSARSVV